MGFQMRTFRVHAEFRCDCNECNGRLGKEPNAFFDDFKVRDGPLMAQVKEAEDLAIAKFNMVLDDIIEEFDGEGHDPRLFILQVKELT